MVPPSVRFTSRRMLDLSSCQDHRNHPSVSSSFFGAHSLRSPSTTNPDPSGGTVYKFTHVFSSSASTTIDLPLNTQEGFFESTTLPLVTDFLAGHNCLMFAYGASGSGKTYTVQGKAGEAAGLLPRALDVIWKSIEGHETTSLVRLSSSCE